VKNILVLTVAGLLVIPLNSAIGDEDPGRAVTGLLDMGECNLVVENVRKIESIKGDRGKVTEASRRNSVLIELEIHGTGPSDGKVGLYPMMFSLTCVYRGVQRILPSLAIGIKPKMPTGKVQPYWLNEPEASMLIGCEEGDDLEFYAVFDVPEDVTEFSFQAPQALQQVLTGPP
jgi:hypothetical protein